MRNLKKVLGMVLCLAMMLGIMVVGANAAFADQSEIDSQHKDAVDMCVSLNIINGIEQDGKTIFKPTGNVTREQMAKMICILDNGGKEPQLASGSTFSDVAADRWSNAYIEACAARGVVAGVGGGKFNPGGDVTATQAAKMLLVELGYKEDLAKYTGSSWATNVNIDATKNGYYEDLEDIDVTAPLTREHAAQMIWNALQAKEITYDYTLVTDPTTGQLISKETPTNLKNPELLADKYGATVKQAYLVGTTYNSTKDEYTYKFAKHAFNGEANAISGDDFFGSSIKDSRDFSDLFGMKVKVVAKGDKLYGITAYESEVLASGIVADLPDSISGDSVKINGTTYDLDKAATDTPIYAYNVSDPAATSLVGYKGAGTGYYAFDLIDNNDDGDANVMVVYPVTVAKLTYANSSEVRADGTKYTFADDTIYSGAAKDDWVVITAKANTVDGKNVIEKLDAVSGKVSSVKADKSINLDGTWYNQATGVTAPNIKDEIDAIVYNGYYFNVDNSSTNLDVAVVTGVGNYDSMNSVLAVKMMFKDGTEQIVNVEKWDSATKKGDLEAKAADVMVSYTIDDDDYTLTTLEDTKPVGNTDPAKTDYKAIVDTKTDQTYTASYNKDNAGIAYKDGKYMDVAADAFIVLKDGDKYTYMTGADLLKKNDINLFTKNKTTPTHADYTFYAAVDKTTGEYNALFAVIGESITTGDELYGMITDSHTALNGDNKEVLYIDVIVDGEKLTNVETDQKTNSTTGWEKGQFITYTMDGNVMNIKNVTADFTYTGAIKEFSDSRVLFYADPISGQPIRYLLTKDTKIIGYDTDDPSNIIYGGNALVAAEAIAFTGSTPTAYYKNATLKLDGNEIVAIFVDVNAPDSVTSYNVTVDFASDAAKNGLTKVEADKSTVVSTGDTVKVTFTGTATAPGTYTISGGKADVEVHVDAGATPADTNVATGTISGDVSLSVTFKAD